MEAINAASPLLLRRLWIRGFRSLDDVGPLVIQPGLTVLTGVNDGGKSATLDAIAFLISGGGVDDRDVSQWAEDRSALGVEGEFVSLDRTNSRRYRARLCDAGTREVEVLEQLHPALGARPADLTLAELREKVQQLGIDSPGGTSKAPFVEAVEEWLAAQPDTELEPHWRRATRDDLDLLPGYSRFDSVQAPSPISHVQGVIAREARRLLQGESFAGELRTVAQGLDQEVASSVEVIKKKILDYCPDLEDIEIEPAFDFTRPNLSIELRVNRSGRAVDLELSGQGRRRRIALAIHEANLEALEVETPTSTEVLAYDEPDTHLDYASQRSLFEILERQARLVHVQAIVATHSLNFIDKVPLDSILHFSLDERLMTVVEVLASEQHEEEQEFLGSICAGLGLRNSVLLDERCFMIVEGDTEEAALPVLFRKATGRTLTTAGVTLINTKGSGAIRRLVEVVATDWQRDVIVLADADARESISGWLDRLGVSEDSDTLYFVGANEFEDAFSDEQWLKAFQRVAPETGGEPWELEEIAALRNLNGEKFSEALCNLVRRRCRDASFGKPDLGLAMAEAIAAKDIPSEIRRCIEGALRLASE